MAVSPNTICGSFCTWVLATPWLEATNPQKALITIVQTAATTSGTVTDNQWNDFLRTTGLWYQYYTAYLAQTTNTASLPANIVQGDLLYGSAANTLSLLAKSATANSFVKNSGTSNNPAWSVVNQSDIADIQALTDYSTTSTINGWSSFTLKKIQYLKIGKVLFVFYDLEGTSNSTAANFTIPFTTLNITNMTFPTAMGFTGDNNVFLTTPGVAYCNPNASIVNLYKNSGLGVWTNANTKFAVGTLMLPIQ